MNLSRNTAPAPDAPAIETPAPDAALVAKAKGERLKHLAADAAHALATSDTERVREIMKAMNGLTVEEVAPLAFITAASLRGKKIELPPLIIEGILRRREVMVFAGESKVGKTWLALSLALAVASGTPWLGQATHAGAVLYLNFEIDGAACNLRTQMLCDGAGVWPEDLHISNLRGTRADIAGMARRIVRAAKERGAVLIIIDALYNALGDRDENSNADMAALIHECTALAVEADAAVCLIHHFNKGSHGAGGDDEAPAANRMAGAGALMRAPDAIVTVTRIKADHLERYGLSDEELNLMVSASLRTQKDLEPFILARATGSHTSRRVAVNVREANTEAARAKRGGRAKVHTVERFRELLERAGPMPRASFEKWCDANGGPRGGTFHGVHDDACDALAVFYRDGLLHPSPRN